jgi:alkanesulfonate monooxygenase SsuD/methylene tetrahydromethanopterin reductase-like flavin-dependent oxidoreductase (luciferase family)
MDAHLDRILEEFADRWQSTPPIYIGGLAAAALKRAGSRGLSLMLPNSLTNEEITKRRQTTAEHAEAAGLPAGRVGMVVDAWICPDEGMADRVRERLVLHYREYAGAWFKLRGEPGFARPDLLDKQSARTREVAAVGTATQVLERLLQLRAAGVDSFVLQVRWDFLGIEYRNVMRKLAEEVLPELRGSR